LGSDDYLGTRWFFGLSSGLVFRRWDDRRPPSKVERIFSNSRKMRCLQTDCLPRHSMTGCSLRDCLFGFRR
jgi:hypothetical protein